MQYVGITIDHRFNQRMGDHKRSNRFKGDEFDVEILERSNNREYIELREEYWISKLDTFNNGLNDTPSGKGWGHRSPNFTTFGYVYSDSSRKLMSESAKSRAKREGFSIRSERSVNNWKQEEYRNKQIQARKGKRLKKPKLSDNQVDEIRNKWNKEKKQIAKELIPINERRMEINSGWRKITPESTFARKYHNEYGVSWKLIENIILNKSRIKKLPLICKS